MQAAIQRDPVQQQTRLLRRWRGIAIAALVTLLGALGWIGWQASRSDSGPMDAAAQLTDRDRRLAEQSTVIGELQQRIATLSRSDQISREANRALQGTLAQRDEEIAELRADIGFYERFVGGTGQRRSLSVHDLALEPQGSQTWRWRTTLMQNLERSLVNRGQLRLAVEGSAAGRLQRLSWAQLRQQADAPGQSYSFKVFQELEGEILLPPGFRPARVTVRLQPQSGAAVERSFAWTDALARPAPAAPAP